MNSFFLLVLATALGAQYLKFSSVALTFPYDRTYFEFDSKDYFVEFWMRPQFDSLLQAAVSLMKSNNDWELSWVPSAASLKLHSEIYELEYCTMSDVQNSQWTHIAFGKVEADGQFVCYRDAGTIGVTWLGTPSEQSAYPDEVEIGLEYSGNLLDLRF